MLSGCPQKCFLAFFGLPPGEGSFSVAIIRLIVLRWFGALFANVRTLRMLQLLEKPTVAQTNQALVWHPDDREVHESFVKMLTVDPPIEPVSPDYYGPDDEHAPLVSVTVRIPAALHERMELARWELRCSASELVRAIMWDKLLEIPTLDVVLTPRQAGG